MQMQRRVYQADQDLERVVALLAGSWTPSGPFTLWHIGDVCWWEQRDWGKSRFLWEDDRGELVAFEDSDRYGDYALLLAPELVGIAAHEQIIAEMEAQPREPPLDLSTTEEHRTFVPQDQPALAAFLEQQGYARATYFKAQFLQSLVPPIGAVALPEGYRIRPLVGEEEIEARAALHQACFGALTPVRYRRVAAICTYRRDLDLVAVAPDGSFAASCLLWLDVHNRVSQIDPKRVDALLCGGDLCSPFIVDELAKFPRQIHVVFGNNDADLFRITQKVNAANQGRAMEDQIRLHGEFFEGELGGKRIALIHYQQIGKALVRSHQYDLVCYGHTHQLSVERDPTSGAICGLNPGEIFGLLGADSEATFVSFDTESSVARKHVIDASGSVTSQPV